MYILVFGIFCPPPPTRKVQVLLTLLWWSIKLSCCYCFLSFNFEFFLFYLHVVELCCKKKKKNIKFLLVFSKNLSVLDLFLFKYVLDKFTLFIKRQCPFILYLYLVLKAVAFCAPVLILSRKVCTEWVQHSRTLNFISVNSWVQVFYTCRSCEKCETFTTSGSLQLQNFLIFEGELFRVRPTRKEKKLLVFIAGFYPLFYFLILLKVFSPCFSNLSGVRNLL